MSKPTTIKKSDTVLSSPPSRVRRPARIDVGPAKPAKRPAKRDAARSAAAKPAHPAPTPNVVAPPRARPASPGHSTRVQRPVKALSNASPGTRKRLVEKEQGIKRVSALDAAAQVLARLSKSESRTGIGAPDLIERMAKARLWTSPGGRTPAATLYAAMIREAAKKGKASRFVRVSPGRFAASKAAS